VVDIGFNTLNTYVLDDMEPVRRFCTSPKLGMGHAYQIAGGGAYRLFKHILPGEGAKLLADDAQEANGRGCYKAGRPSGPDQRGGPGLPGLGEAETPPAQAGGGDPAGAPAAVRAVEWTSGTNATSGTGSLLQQ